MNAAHHASPAPVWRFIMWLAGLLAILVALASPLDALAEQLLTAHMVQHLLLAMVAPPLLALGAPVVLALRVAGPNVRSSILLPVLRNRIVQLVASPLVAWILFTAVMWLAHFTPIYEAALESEPIHVLEHLAFLLTGCLFWWPAVAADPMPHRLRPAWRLADRLAEMPVNAAIGLVIYFAPLVLYTHYAATAPAAGLDALTDQQVGGLIMWGAGDVLLLLAVALVVAALMRAGVRRDERQAARARRKA